MSYRIMSFNIKTFNPNADNTDDNLRVKHIAKMIRDNNVDIVAIQEIMKPSALKLLMSELAGYTKEIEPEEESIWRYSKLEYSGYRAQYWEGRWVKPNSQWVSSRGEEGFAFIWNTKRIQLAQRRRYREKNSKQRGYARSNDIEPYIERKKNSMFVRPPFYGRFETTGLCKAEIRIINMHVVFSSVDEKRLLGGKTRTELTDEEYMNLPPRIKLALELVEKGEKKRRDAEIYNMIKYVLDPNDNYPGARRNAYTILLGDYNLRIIPPEKAITSGMSFSDEVYLEKGSNGPAKYVSIQKRKSTLKSPPTKGDLEEYKNLIGEDRFYSSYDHFTYNKKIEYAISDKCGETGDEAEYRILDFFNDPNNDHQKYLNEVSDHLPVMVQLNLGGMS